MQTTSISRVRGWLQLLRPHSIALTLPLAIIGIALTHPTIISTYSIFWGLYSIFWGFTGNIHNAVADYNLDKNDLYKKHFPLVSGVITLRSAKIVTYSMLLSLWILGVLGCNLDPKYSLLVTFGIAAGLSYNLTSKTFGASALLAGLSFPVPFLLAAHDTSNLIIFVYAYLVIQFMLQNGLSGGYKDLQSDSSNMVKALGVSIRNGIIQQTLACGLFSFGTRIAMFILIILIAVQKTFVPFVMIPFTILVILVLAQSTAIKYSKKRFMLYFAFIEMASYYMLVTTITPMLDSMEMLFLFLFPIISYIIFNKISWGSTLVPKT